MDGNGRGAGAHLDHGGAEIGFVVGQDGEAGRIGAAARASTLRWQRSTTSIRFRATAASTVTTLQVDAELAGDHAAGIANAFHTVERSHRNVCSTVRPSPWRGACRSGDPADIGRR